MTEHEESATPPVGEQVDEALAATALRMQAEALQQANDAQLQALNVEIQRLGGQGVDAASILSVRLQALVDLLLGGEESAARWQYEVHVQRTFAQQLGALAAQVRQAKLTAGTSQAGGLLIPTSTPRRVRPDGQG